MDKIKAKQTIEEITGDDVGNLIEIRNVFTKFDKYVISEHPDILAMDDNKREQLRKFYEANPFNKKPYKELEYIVGYNPSYNFSTKKFEYCSVSTNELDLLLSLIELIKEPIDMNNLQESFSNDEIIKWCERYTLPGLSKHEKIQENKNTSDFPTLFYNCMLLDIFYFEVTILYSLFNLWRAALEEDNEKIKHYATLLKKDFDITKKAAVDIILSVFIDEKMKNIYMRFLNFGENKLFLDTDDIFSMCYFQLANLITKPSESKKHLRECKNCRRLFWGHGNSGYCSNCDRRTVWSRKNRH
jgi:hypothetical protein